MSIRALARELYRAQQNIDRLEKLLENAPHSEAENIRIELRVAKAEHAMLRKMMNGEKESSDFRIKFKGFGT